MLNPLVCVCVAGCRGMESTRFSPLLEWPNVQRSALGTCFWQDLIVEPPLRVFSGWAGTGAEIHAAKLLLGVRNVSCDGCDANACAAAFYKGAHRPNHFFHGNCVELLAGVWSSKAAGRYSADEEGGAADEEGGGGIAAGRKAPAAAAAGRGLRQAPPTAFPPPQPPSKRQSHLLDE